MGITTVKYYYLLLIIASLSEFISIYSSHALSSNRSLLSRIENTRATIDVQVGRISGTAMPSEWASSGAKLGFTLHVSFTTNSTVEQKMTNKEILAVDALMGTTLQTIVPLEQPSFISVSGSESIIVKPGAYGCQIQNVDSNQYALRWYLDFPNGAKRNDVVLPQEHIYFLTRCWLVPLSSCTEDGGMLLALENARKEKKHILSTMELTNARLNKIQNYSPPAGNNILGDIVQKAFNFRHVIKLKGRNKELQSRLDMLERTYPLDDDRVMIGLTKDVWYEKEGVIAAKKKSKYLWIGRFKFRDLL